jgi:ribosomal protein L37E
MWCSRCGYGSDNAVMTRCGNCGCTEIVRKRPFVSRVESESSAERAVKRLEQRIKK